jgi:hypothetical protein
VAVVAISTTHLTHPLAVALAHQVALMGPRPVVQRPAQAPLAEAVGNLTFHPLLALPLALSKLALPSLRQASPMSPHLKLGLSLVVALVHLLLLKCQPVVIQLVNHSLFTLIQ